MTDSSAFSASDFLDALEYKINDKHAMVRETTEAFCTHLQVVLDEFKRLSDSDNAGGRVKLAKLYLLTQSVNDVLAGFHLGRQGYSRQAFSLLRSPLEAADLIKLFDREPSAIDTWYEGGQAAYNKLRPSVVRTRLGQTKDGVMIKLYNLISEMGTHNGFVGSKNHTALRRDTKTVHIWVGGVLFEHSFMFVSLMSFIVTLQLWMSVDIVYKDVVTTDDFKKVGRQLIKGMNDFVTMYPDFFKNSNMGDITGKLVKEFE